MDGRQVVVYSKDHCPWCVQLKEFLHANKVSYQLKEIDKDPEARAYLRDVLRSRGVPTIVIGDQVIIGFQVDQIKQALGL